MTPDQFVQDAIRTESRIETITLNPEAFAHLTTALIALGSMLDQIKKHTFYKKPFDNAQLILNIEAAKYSVARLSDQLYYTWKNEKPTEFDSRIFHSVVGITTEAVELLQALKINPEHTDKLLTRDLGNSPPALDFVNLREEFGDLMWYIAIGVDQTGGDFEAVLDRVIAKLKTRYPNKFNNEDAINRNLEEERRVLEERDSLVP